MRPKPVHPETPLPRPYPKRFSWKMRLFLTVFLFALAYRCLAILFPMSEWCAKYGIDELPPPLPSPAERIVLRERASTDDHWPVLGACLSTADSVWEFLRPWPSAKSRERIDTAGDGLKCAACWVYTKVLFMERLAGLTEK